MPEVLENIPFEDVAKAIQQISLPKSAHVRVVIETVNDASVNKGNTEFRYQFWEELDSLPTPNDLPEDLAHQHDHYLYATPKRS